MTAFWTLHSALPREGPGETADVAWAAGVAGLRPDARIADVACGPGGDIGALLRAAPDGHVLALDRHAPFIDAAADRFGHHARVTLTVGDMAALSDCYDLIWCAGAVYFMCINLALAAWRGALVPGGAVVFSEPCLFTDAPSGGAVALWDGYARLTDAAGIAAQIMAAGYEVLATRRVSDIGWESYFRPLAARIAGLRPDADADLTAVLDAATQEIALWRAHRAETGYLICVVRPA